MISRATLSGLGWAVVAITVWSGSLVMLRHGMMGSLNAYDLTFLRFGVAAVILVPVVLRQRTALAQLGLIRLGLMVVTFGAPYVALISLALKTAPASAAGALNPGVMAMASVLMGRVIFGDKICAAPFAGLLLTAFGTGLFVQAGGEITGGHLLLIGTGIMWASYALIIRSAAVPALTATAIVAMGSAILYLPIYLVALPKQILTAPLEDVLIQAGFQGVLVSVVAIYAFSRSAEILGHTTGATLPALIPVVTLGLGVLFLGETAGSEEVVSAILVTLGLALILVGKPALRWRSPHIAPTLKRKGTTQDQSEDHWSESGEGLLRPPGVENVH